MANLIKFLKRFSGLKEKEGGLDKAFSIGEHIPLKGIWFEVESVKFDEIILRPKTTTSKRMKVIRNLRMQNA